jgi:hypothetical protein
MKILRIACFSFIITLLSCSTGKEQTRDYIDLGGTWQFALDTSGEGIHQEWFNSDLADSILLPGTTDLNQKGFPNRDTTTMHLNRAYRYEGAAWYRKKVVIPEEYDGKRISLSLERTKSSKVWVDSLFAGESKILQAPQQFDLTDYLSPGIHYITILVDNSLKLTPYGNVHIYSDDTQTNWNGIIGQLFLEVKPQVYISNLQVTPDIDEKKIDIRLEMDGLLDAGEMDIELAVEKTVDGKTTRLKNIRLKTTSQKELNLEYLLGDECSLWDEYRQPLYRLTATISDGSVKDSETVAFGMREFSVNGTQFAINGRTVFLRGKHDAAVFPMTGFTPMDVDEWLRVFTIAREYGINHYRFHSYCPPEAAFTAADQLGIYLQAELPFWGGLGSDTVANSLKEEGLAMLKAYANHPSFVMFSPGNEIWGGHEEVEQIMLALKSYDSRPLYTMGSNNNIGYRAPDEYAEFFVGARIPDRGDSTIGHTRLTHAFADARDGGILNTFPPSATINYDYAVSKMDLPIVSHEIGQYQIFPDYGEIDKYTGVLKAWNLEVFRGRLEKAGMAGMDSAFQQASGAWSAICYKAEMEAALRTRGFAGFQLLDLQDFPGQGTALVGILDAFMDSKNVVTAEAWRQSCNDVVLLPEFAKYCWTNNETFGAKVLVANYSDQTLQADLKWEIRKQDGSVIDEGSFTGLAMDNGGLATAGEITADLSSVRKAENLTLHVSLPGTGYSNSHPLWVYPNENSVEIPDGIVVAGRLSGQVMDQLQSGGKVLLFPQTEDISKNSVPGHFPPDFWNYGMFKGISESVNKPVSPGTLGLLTDLKHPLFNDFPTESHTNWQWFSIIRNSHSLILDNTSADYRPIVQVIDNLERNHKLGLIFEFKVGNGKLLVCMSPLNQLMDKPEVVSLYQSMLNYMVSEKFSPGYQITGEELTWILGQPHASR